MPNDAELRRTGMSFRRAFIATAMCSPSRSQHCSPASIRRVTA